MDKLFLSKCILMTLLLLVGCSASEAVPTDLEGESLFTQTTLNRSPGCVTCHALEPDVRLVGPSIAGVASRAAETLNDPAYTGSAETVEGYLREAILYPDVYIPEGFISGAMYQDYAEVLSSAEVQALVDYMLTMD